MENNMPQSSPVNFVMNQFAIASGPREIALIFGQTRHIVDQQTGLPTLQGKEWLASYSLSPITAQQLQQALAKVIEDYETQFGKIPVDEKLQVNQVDVSAAGI